MFSKLNFEIELFCSDWKRKEFAQRKININNKMDDIKNIIIIRFI